jgi:hypothetical protein
MFSHCPRRETQLGPFVSACAAFRPLGCRMGVIGVVLSQATCCASGVMALATERNRRVTKSKMMGSRRPNFGRRTRIPI